MIAATPSSTDCRREPQNARATTLPTDNIINGNGLIQLLGPESATISGARTLDETQAVILVATVLAVVDVTRPPPTTRKCRRFHLRTDAYLVPGDSNAVTPLSMSLAYLQGVFSMSLAT